MTSKLLLSLTLALALTGAAHAQPSGGLAPMAKPYAEPNALPLYPGVAPGSENAKQVEQWMSAPSDIVVRNVTKPTITPYLPAKGKATGAAVVVMPGGGNVVLAMGKEGYEVGKFLAANGIAAFVMKYRLEETPADITQMRPMGPAVGAPSAAPAGAPPPPPAGALPVGRYGVVDGKEALRWVRAHATQYGVDPKRVGIVGFSAGAGNIWGVLDADDATAKPNFIAPIYGGFGARPTLAANPPPLFVAAASDDALMMRPGTNFSVVDQWMKAGGKVELHLYQNGHHGFGALKQGTTSDLFLDQLLLWIRVNGFLKAAS